MALGHGPQTCITVFSFLAPPFSFHSHLLFSKTSQKNVPSQTASKMAGALAVVAGERLPESPAIASTGGHWEVCFSRFFPLAARPSACPSLAPLRDSDRRRLCPSGGTWLSSSSKASLLLHPGPAAIVTVCLGGKLLVSRGLPRLLILPLSIRRLHSRRRARHWNVLLWCRNQSD